MKKWKRGASLLSTAALLGMTIACSSGGDADKETNNKGEKEPQSSNSIQTSGFPISQEAVTLKIFAQKSPPNGPYKDMLVFQEYEKMTNVKIVWEDVPSEGFVERKNLLFASNELPDALFKAGISQLEAVKYGSSGMLVPLEDLIVKYAPNLQALFDKYPEILASIKAPDGHIYALPAIVTLGAARTDKPWINKSWLEALNLKEPETTDELLTVLRAFRDGDPNGNGKKDEIPVSEWDRNALINSMAGSWGLDFQMGYNINIQDGKVKIWLADPAFKEYLQYLHQLYQEKLIDPELFTQNASQFVAKMASGNLGYFHNQASDPFTDKKEDFAGIAPLAGPDGERKGWGRPVARDFGTFAITSVNKNPEATMRWIDYFYGDEGSIFFRYGIEGQTYNKKADGLPEYTEEILTDKRGTGTTIGQFSPWPGGGAPHLINENNSSAINPPEVQAAQEKMDPYMPKEILGAPIFDDATSKEVNTLRQDLDTYVGETTSKLITGALSFDKWDAYVKTLNQMDLSRLESIYQEAYDKNK
ncbi:extracellular solute-binding protein [Paenibacillus nasutitermitis]|uniref:ABC transporter substrate-binding protein n=1 Tax=Paenibacillus nasutitermitis TaxID=1652958 RepID=A0A916Z7U8_9BACL|nr:extracellular solute-binding protein [Paenibacillus nasutitermitis]GGD78551.1 ABC transporter substrate-binding protein [Paenibacillus nasutitermitis]